MNKNVFKFFLKLGKDGERRTSDVDQVFEILDNVGENHYYEAAADHEALTKYFTPRRNTAYEVYQFRQAKQEKAGTLDTYSTCITPGYINSHRHVKSHMLTMKSLLKLS